MTSRKVTEVHTVGPGLLTVVDVPNVHSFSPHTKEESLLPFRLGGVTSVESLLSLPR